jgi:hypothetical protein
MPLETLCRQNAVQAKGYWGKPKKGGIAIDEKYLECSAHADDGKCSSLGGAW